MIKNYIYLAIVEKDFELNNKVREYFDTQDIKILKYYKSLELLQLESIYKITTTLKYIRTLELEEKFYSI